MRKQKGRTRKPTEPNVRRLRIRRCQGNRDCWCIVSIRQNGTEVDSYGGFITGYSLDALIAGGALNLTPRAGDVVEFVP